MGKIKKILRNKVILYVGTRYMVYGLQFISLIILASKLGKYYYGIWGFILMLLNYMNIINLGIPNTVNIITVQNKNSITEIRNSIASAFSLIAMMIGILALIGVIYAFWPDYLVKKYSIGSLFYIVLLIGALQYINVVMVNIFRACNKLFEVAVYQSAIPIGVFCVLLMYQGEKLIDALVWTYFIVNILSVILFLSRGRNFWGGYPSWLGIKKILKKGFFLFIYNACFYLLLTTTSSLVSIYYSVEQYGIYSFSYTLSHAVLMFMEAFMYIIFPKVIDKLYTGDNETVENTINALRVNYISVSHLLIYIALIAFPIIILLFPQFKGSLTTLNIMMLAIVLSSNSFGYNSFLIARNKEKQCAGISFISLILNICFGFILIKIFHVNYTMVIFTIMFSYLLFAMLCSYIANTILKKNLNLYTLFISIFPIRVLIPYVVAIIVSLIGYEILYFTPLLLFIVLNLSTCKEMLNSIQRILKNPNIIDIKKN